MRSVVVDVLTVRGRAACYKYSGVYFYRCIKEADFSPCDYWENLRKKKRSKESEVDSSKKNGGFYYCEQVSLRELSVWR